MPNLPGRPPWWCRKARQRWEAEQDALIWRCAVEIVLADELHHDRMGIADVCQCWIDLTASPLPDFLRNRLLAIFEPQMSVAA